MKDKLLNGLCKTYKRDYMFYGEMFRVMNRLFMYKHDKKDAVKAMCKTWKISSNEAVAVYDFWLNSILLDNDTAVVETENTYNNTYNIIDMRLSNLLNSIESEIKWNLLMNKINNVMFK